MLYGSYLHFNAPTPLKEEISKENNKDKDLWDVKEQQQKKIVENIFELIDVFFI